MSTQITALRSANVFYTQSFNLNGALYYVAPVVLEPVEEVVCTFPDTLAQGTRGHNTNVCHRSFSGGGSLPFVQSGKSCYIVQHLNVFGVSGDPTSTRTEDRTTFTLSRKRWEFTGEFRDPADPIGPCHVIEWNWVEREKYSKVTGDLILYQAGGYLSIMTEIYMRGTQIRCKAKKVSIDKTFRDGSMPTAESLLYEAWSQATTVSDGALSKLRLRAASEPQFLDYDLGDISYIKLRRGPYPRLVEHVKAQAFVNACDEFPKQCDNQLANMVDVLSLMKVALDPSEVVRSVLKAFNSGFGSMWMWWRYAYTTSMSDIKQAIDYSYRQKMSMWMSHRYDGFASESVTYLSQPCNVECHCSFKARIKPSKLYSNTQWERGVELNPYVIWDMIPLSFVADWFFDVGDKLELENNLKHYLSDYTWEQMFFRTTYRACVEQLTHVEALTYTREYTGPPSILRGSFIPSSRDDSVITIGKRGVDALSLVQVF